MSTPSPSPDSGRMRFRKLRIAWSVVWGIACLLVIVLWVKSYWWVSGIETPFGNPIYIEVQNGQFLFNWYDENSNPASTSFFNKPINAQVVEAFETFRRRMHWSIGFGWEK